MASSIRGYSQPSSPNLQDVFPVILLAIRWQNTSNTFIIASVIIQLSLLYTITACTTYLYIIDLDLNVAPVFCSNFNTMPHRLLAFPRLWYRDKQSLFLYVMVHPM